MIFKKKMKQIAGIEKVVNGFGDITERKKMEQDLLLSSEVTKNMAEGVYLVRVSDVAIVYANPKFEKMFGYEPGEMIGKHASIVNAPTDKKPEETAKEIMGIIAKTGEWHGEVNNIKKDGTPFWCFANVSVFDHPQYGKVLVAVHTDITERKKAEDETKESERLLNLYIRNVPAGIIEWDKDFQVVNWNPAAEKIFGYTKAEAMGRHANFIIPEEVRPHVDGIWKQLLSGAVTLSTNENITKDGRTIVCEWHNAPLSTVSGKVFGVVSMMLDITERKKTEEELEKSETRYKALVDAAPLCIKLFDAQGNLVSVNKHGREEHMLVGKNDEEIKKWKYIECIEPAYRTLVAQKMKEALGGKKSEFEFEHVPGTTTIGHWCYSYLTPVADEAGTISHVLFISRDITAEKNVAEGEQKNIAQLTKLNEVMIGRELKMVELKKELQALRDSQKNEPNKGEK